MKKFLNILEELKKTKPIKLKVPSDPGPFYKYEAANRQNGNYYHEFSDDILTNLENVLDGFNDYYNTNSKLKYSPGVKENRSEVKLALSSEAKKNFQDFKNTFIKELDLTDKTKIDKGPKCIISITANGSLIISHWIISANWVNDIDKDIPFNKKVKEAIEKTKGTKYENKGWYIFVGLSEDPADL